MKITGLAIIIITLVAASVSADSSFVGVGAGDTDIADGDVKNYSPVSIDVYCKGVDWPSLTAKEDEATAEMLQQAYNIVHQRLDGDKFLATVHYEGINMGSEDEEEKDKEEEDDDYSNENDQGLERKKKPPKKSPHYKGGVGCRLCNPDEDDDFMLSAYQLGGAGKSLVAWEKKFAEMLKQCPYAALHNPKKCDIYLTVENVDVDEKDGDEQPPHLRGSSIAMNDIVAAAAAAAHFDKKQGGTTTAEY